VESAPSHALSAVVAALQVAWLVEQLWVRLGEPLEMAGGEKAILKQVRSSIEVFDSELGQINFPEFLIMLTRQPWRDLLPEHGPWGTPDRSPSPVALARPVSPYQRNLSPPASKGVQVAQAILSEAHELFAAADSDNDGLIREAELRDLVHALWKGLDPDAPVVDVGVLNREVAVHMATHDAEDKGVGFNAFLAMLGASPWKDRVPEAIREELVQVIEKRVYKNRKDKNWLWQVGNQLRRDPPEKVILALARQLFEEAGGVLGKGLEEEGIAATMITFWKRLGHPLQADQRVDLMAQVRGVMSQYDRLKTGRLKLDIFLKMLTMPPWKHQLPKELQASFPVVVLAEIRKIREAEAPVYKWRPWHDQAKEGGGAMVLRMAKAMFEEADRESLEPRELVGLMQRLLTQIGGAEGNDVDNTIIQGIRAATAAEGAGTEAPISEAQFLRLLCIEPWAGLLPEDIRGELETAVRRSLRSPSPNRHAPAVLMGSDPASRSEYLVQCAKRIFEQYDRDSSGDLDDGEVATCLVDLFQNLQKKLPPQFQMNLMSEVRKVIAMNDMDNNGRLNFVEFMRLLTRKPWKASYPLSSCASPHPPLPHNVPPSLSIGSPTS